MSRTRVRSISDAGQSRKYPNWSEVVERAPERFPGGFTRSMVRKLAGQPDVGGARRRERTNTGNTNKHYAQLAQTASFEAGVETSTFGKQPQPGSLPDTRMLARRPLDTVRNDPSAVHAAEQRRRAAAAETKRYFDMQYSLREAPIDHPNPDPDALDRNPPVAVLARRPRNLPNPAESLERVLSGQLDAAAEECIAERPLMRVLPATKPVNTRLPALLGSVSTTGLSLSARSVPAANTTREPLKSTIGPDTCDSAHIASLSCQFSDEAKMRRTYSAPQLAQTIVPKTRLGATKYSQTSYLTEGGSDSAGFASNAERFSSTNRGLDTTWQRQERALWAATGQQKLERKRHQEQRVHDAYAAEEGKQAGAAMARAAGRAALRQKYHEAVRCLENQRAAPKATSATPNSQPLAPSPPQRSQCTPQQTPQGTPVAVPVAE